MEEFVQQWLFDPVIGKVISAVVGLLLIYVIARFLQRALATRIKDPDARYRTRKAIAFAGYVVGIMLVAAVLSDQLGSLTVAFGVAGAGVAFALAGGHCQCRWLVCNIVWAVLQDGGSRSTRESGVM
jgi:Na+/H+ antiporter NhaD/arsenite permease-like protein